MKKEYIEPSVKAVEIKLNHLMVLSDPNTGTNVNPNTTPVDDPSGMDSFDAEFEDDF